MIAAPARELGWASIALVEQIKGRTLRQAEQAIDVLRLDQALNGAKDELEAAIFGEMVSATAAWKAGVALWPALRVTDEMLAILDRLTEVGREESLLELDRLGYSGIVDSDGRLYVFEEAPVARDVAGYLQRELPGVETRIVDELLETDLSHASQSAIAQALLAVPGARDIASRVISTALIDGIGMTFEQNADLVKCWEYTAVLDAGTCPRCAPLDGKRYESLQELFKDLPNFGPNPECRGGGRCRCRAVPCSTREVGQHRAAPDAKPETAAQIGKRLGDEYQPWLDSLTDDELEAVRYYQGAAFRTVNRHFREGSPLVGENGRRAKTMIPKLDKAIAKSATPEDLVVYRGLSNVEEVFGADLEKLVGRTFVDKSYVSTTVSRTKAAEFSQFGRSAIIEVEVPEGSKAIYMPKAAAAGRDAQRIRAERELLLPRGSKFEVISVTDSGRGRAVIRVRLLP